MTTHEECEVPVDPEGSGTIEVGVVIPAPEDDGDTVDDVSSTAAASKRIILPLVVPFPYM
jgi:hypothetical protein